MPFHLAAYTSNIDLPGDTDVPALADGALTINSGHFQLRQRMDLVAAFAGSATLLRARIDSPTARLVARPYIRPVQNAVLPATDPNLMDLTRSPYRLQAAEEIAVQGTISGGLAERFTALIWLMNRMIPVPKLNITPTRATSTTAAVANAWSLVTLTWESAFPAGLYAMVGCEAQSTNLIAARWLFDNQIERPGFLGMTPMTSRTHKLLYQLELGVWGYFLNTNLPRCEVLANAADASFVFHPWIVKISDSMSLPGAL